MKLNRGNRSFYLLLIALLTRATLWAQSDKVNTAVHYIQSGQLDSAKTVLEQALQHKETANSPTAWYYYSFTWKEIYKSNKPEYTALKRDVILSNSIEAAKKSISLDSSKENSANNRALIKFCANKYFQLASQQLDSINHNTAIENFNKYRSLMKIADPSATLTKSDTSFYLVLGVLYSNMSKTRPEYLKKASNAFIEVLKIDSNCFKANFNNGRLYYNKGAEMLTSLSYDDPISVIDTKQDSANKYFRMALPYLLKANHLSPSRVEVTKALGAIYYSLHEYKKAEAYYINAYNANKKDVDVVNSMITIYERLGDDQNSLKFILIAHELQPNDVGVTRYVISKYIEQGQYQKAEPYLLDVHNKDPKDKEIIKVLISIYQKLGNEEKEKEFYNKLKQ